MKYVLMIVAVLAILAGFFTLMDAKTVMHEGTAMLILILGFNSLGFAGVIEAIEKNK